MVEAGGSTGVAGGGAGDDEVGGALDASGLLGTEAPAGCGICERSERENGGKQVVAYISQVPSTKTPTDAQAPEIIGSLCVAAGISHTSAFAVAPQAA
jgi:hypothetical protein